MHQIFPLGTLLLSGAVATPATKTLPIRNDKRQDAEPSSYPAGQPCANEFKYLNFDISDEVQLSRFFPDNDGARSDVMDVYNALVDTSNGMAKPIVADMILDNNDFLGLCGGGEDDDSDEGQEAGYQGQDNNGDGRRKFHMCDEAFEFPTNPAENECRDLGDHPSKDWESLARLMLHETLHFPSVGNPIFNSQIVDQLNDDQLHAYYPQRTHGLVDPNQDNDDGQSGEIAVTNADSYAWHATNSYYKFACNNVEEPGPNGQNWFDPPAYTPGEPGDA